MADRSEQFEDLLRRAHSEPHQKIDQLAFQISAGTKGYAGYDAAEAKRFYLASAGEARVSVETTWRRKPKFFHDGDDPEDGLAIRAEFDSIELRQNGSRFGPQMTTRDAEAMIRLLRRAIHYAKPVSGSTRSSQSERQAG